MRTARTTATMTITSKVMSAAASRASGERPSLLVPRLLALSMIAVSASCAGTQPPADGVRPPAAPGTTEGSPPPAEPAPPASPAPPANPAAPAPAAPGAPPAPAAPPAPPAPPAPSPPAEGGREVLVFTRTTGYRHASIERAAESIRLALAAAGWRVLVTDDPKQFAPGALGRFAGIVLVSTTGKPLGDPATAELAGFETWLRAGGGLAALHAASSTQYDPALPYIRLVGGKFINHPGSVRPANCHPEGDHAAVTRLPSPFPVRDEIYRFEQLNPANVVMLRCDELTGGGKLPIAWHRQEGAGRVFYSALGHAAEDYAPDARVFKDHLLPGILWSLSR
jgi:uncharacterized protein